MLIVKERIKKFPIFVKPESSLLCSLESEALGDISKHAVLHNKELVASGPTPKAGGQSLVGCPRLGVQYIRSYLRFQTTSIPNPRTYHAVVIRNPLNVVLISFHTDFKTLFL
jgi:hypothetical protein